MLRAKVSSAAGSMDPRGWYFPGWMDRIGRNTTAWLDAGSGDAVAITVRTLALDVARTVEDTAGVDGFGSTVAAGATEVGVTVLAGAAVAAGAAGAARAAGR